MNIGCRICAGNITLWPHLLLGLTMCGQFASAQSISSLYLLDGDIYVLKEEEDSIHFGYFSESYATISAYLEHEGASIILFSDQTDFRGTGFINISRKTFTSIINQLGLFNAASLRLIMTHMSQRTSQYTYNTLPLIFNIVSPYGCEVYELSPRPPRRGTNIQMKVLDVRAIIGMIVGALLTLSGSERQRNATQDTGEGGEELQAATNTMIYGAVVMLISYVSLYKYVPDNSANEINQEYNKRILAQWERRVEEIMDLNELIINTCLWRVSVHE